MNFTAAEFVVFFPLVLLLYRLLPLRLRWVELLAASYFFYGVWNPWTLPLLAGTTLISWLCARQIDAAAHPAVKKAWLSLACLVCLGCLGLFKYGSFAAGSLATLLGLDRPVFQLLLPVGISFYTFQTLSYVLDVYRGSFACERHLGYYALFISFFPQLVAGPIERPGALLPQLHALRSPKREDLLLGSWRLLRGYFKKVVLADRLAPFVDLVYGSAAVQPGPAILLATIGFGLQIYFDFSAYSDIAVGAARLLGIHLMENFDHPYRAASLPEFWRRWHISLTGWFTDYLYIPLGGSRCSRPRWYRNLLVVFLASGLWHGAAWHFVLWGAFHGVCMIGCALWRQHSPIRLPVWAGRLATLAAVGIGWVLFRAQDVPQALQLLAGLFAGWNGAGLAAAAGMLGKQAALTLALGLLAYRLIPERLEGLPAARAAMAVFHTSILTGLGGLWLAADAVSSAFLYFQF